MRDLAGHPPECGERAAAQARQLARVAERDGTLRGEHAEEIQIVVSGDDVARVLDDERAFRRAGDHERNGERCPPVGAAHGDRVAPRDRGFRRRGKPVERGR